MAEVVVPLAGIDEGAAAIDTVTAAMAGEDSWSTTTDPVLESSDSVAVIVQKPAVVDAV
jgi:hypothetical protein